MAVARLAAPSSVGVTTAGDVPVLLLDVPGAVFAPSRNLTTVVFTCALTATDGSVSSGATCLRRTAASCSGDSARPTSSGIANALCSPCCSSGPLAG